MTTMPEAAAVATAAIFAVLRAVTCTSNAECCNRDCEDTGRCDDDQTSGGGGIRWQWRNRAVSGSGAALHVEYRVLQQRLR